MEKTINISGKDVRFKATAGTIRQYRARFGRDLLVDFRRLQNDADKAEPLTAETLTIFENLAYIMAKQADPTIPADPDDWLDEFDMFDIYIVLPQIVELWGIQSTPIAEKKTKPK